VSGPGKLQGEDRFRRRGRIAPSGRTIYDTRARRTIYTSARAHTLIPSSRARTRRDHAPKCLPFLAVEASRSFAARRR
jgi:hypothetical protein